MSLCHFPEGFCMKTLFDNDWEGRANRSQHTHHGKHGWYQFKGNIFTITMMSIYEMSLYYLVLSCISYSTQIHQHSCSWYFINIITIIVWAVCSDNSHSPPRWKNISSIITSLSVHALRPVYISSLSLVHLYLSCVDGGSLTVEVGLSNVRRQMNVHLFNNSFYSETYLVSLGASVAHLTPCFHIVVHRIWIELDAPPSLLGVEEDC